MFQAEDVATQTVRTISPRASLRDAAFIMEHDNLGFLPVVDGRKTVGVITDRDLALKGIRIGAPDLAHVSQIMTTDLIWVNDTSTLADVAQQMSDRKVRRVLVHNSAGELKGVISLDDLAIYTKGDQTVGQILQRMAKPHSMLQLKSAHGAARIEGVYAKAS